MPYYEHRRLWAPAMIFMTVVLVGVSVWVYRDALAELVVEWRGNLFFVAVWSWFHFMVGRHANRHVRVDEQGLWIDGELAVEADEVLALGLAQDSGAEGLRRVGGPGLPRPRDHPTTSRSSWLQHNWVRIVHAPGIETVGVVTRARDLVRGSWLPGVVVVTKRWYGPGLREAWLISGYRLAALGEALSLAAPDAHLIFSHGPAAEQAHAPGVEAPGSDDTG